MFSVIRGEMQLSIQRDAMESSSDAESSTKAREVALDKILLQLVQGACKADNLSRALDIARLMHNPATVEAASKVAAFYHLPGLQERIQGVKITTDQKRSNDQRARRALPQANVHSKKARGASYGEFAPKTARRSFGGVQRDVTPAISQAESYVPETPGVESTPAPMTMDVDSIDVGSSPEGKRKRHEEEDSPAAERKPELPPPNGASLLMFPITDTGVGTAASSASTLGPKNPFAKRPAGSNPFARPAVAQPLDTIKSTSFFERVDNIESSGPAKGEITSSP